MRLTNEVRNGIIADVLKKQITPRVEAVRVALKALAQVAAEERYPKTVQEWLDAAPKGGVSYANGFCLQLGGAEQSLRHELLTGKNRYGYVRDAKITLKKSVPVLAADQYTGVLVLSSALTKRARDILATLDALLAEQREIEETLRAALWACNTGKQLGERYPDLDPYLQKWGRVAGGQTQALAVTNDDIARVLNSAA